MEPEALGTPTLTLVLTLTLTLTLGGSDAEGELLNDLHSFDTIAESWSKPAALGELPTPRTGHGACFVAERYLVVYGGTDVDGKVIDTASAYDIVSGQWHEVKGSP